MSTLSPDAHLPPEIVMEIVKWNSTNRSVLRQCCLVSHLWRNASLPFLFHEVKLRGAADFCSWHDATPEVLRHIRRVVFRHAKNYSRPHECDHEYEPRSLSMVHKIPVSPQVLELVWLYRDYTTTVTPDVVKFLATFPSLEAVKIDSGIVDTAHFKHFVGSCGRLKKLELGMSTTSIFRPQLVPVQKLRIQDPRSIDLSLLQSLIIGTDDFPMLLEALFADSKPARLLSFTITCTANYSDLSSVWHFLNMFSSTIQHLTLDTHGMTGDELPPPLRSSMICSPCPSLHTFTLTGLHDPKSCGGFCSEMVRWLPTLFRYLPGRLTTLELKFTAVCHQEFEAVFSSRYGWRKLATSILKLYPTFTRIVIWLNTDSQFFRFDDRMALVALSKEKMPDLGPIQVEVEFGDQYYR
ncbi:hypothetical protein Moror_13215 [Moniliophthora roreri MCA 2997]|uniref:Uncharacterized protein n=2 Tax=Moniliophthora roreri TaxID=221103 RepID=V2WQ04_MONRO|nr:hypothetical protein Moror_13215 [Moniliophthora roreri MCA 2997]KAI3603267.1 hypothetical protein WG66_002270 [Moniliophthora roreri]